MRQGRFEIFVIPAQAGIQGSGNARDARGRRTPWAPACAGATLAYFPSIEREVTTGFFFASVSVSTPFSSLALVASASMSAGSS